MSRFRICDDCGVKINWKNRYRTVPNRCKSCHIKRSLADRHRREATKQRIYTLDRTLKNGKIITGILQERKVPLRGSFSIPQLAKKLGINRNVIRRAIHLGHISAKGHKKGNRDYWRISNKMGLRLGKLEAEERVKRLEKRYAKRFSSKHGEAKSVEMAKRLVERLEKNDRVNFHNLLSNGSYTRGIIRRLQKYPNDFSQFESNYTRATNLSWTLHVNSLSATCIRVANILRTIIGFTVQDHKSEKPVIMSIPAITKCCHISASGVKKALGILKGEGLIEVRLRGSAPSMISLIGAEWIPVKKDTNVSAAENLA